MKIVKCRVFCFKVLMCLLYPVARFKKLIRKSKLKPSKIGLVLMVTIIIFIMYLLFLNWSKFTFLEVQPAALTLKSTSAEANVVGTPMKHLPLNEIYPDQSRHFPNESYEIEEFKPSFMLETHGCKIPLAMIDYTKGLKNNKNSGTCGKRAVFLKKIDTDKVKALIKPKIMKKYLRKSVYFDCCYRFLSRSSQPRFEDKRIKFTKCVKFQDSETIKLETDFINVKCFDYDKRNQSHAIYEDIYAFTKKINVTKPSRNNCRMKYNVLMIGMDSMSLARFGQTLTRTLDYLKDNFWLGYRGYHKVEDNTFPNLMAVLTGKDITYISDKCTSKMDKCQNILIWNEFKKAGYMTAYGEDYLRLPDTFSNRYAFAIPPTDHYMRPFFLKGETELNNKSLVCAGKVSSGQQVLNYALDFANTYRSDQFFGLFWMNSFSHNVNSRPQDADVMLENFFNQLAYTGVLKNTFVVALSDHGIRFGEHRLKVESYYDERMPFLFILTPEKFRSRHTLKYKSLAENSFRLVTPYDLHNTLIDIKDISECKNTTRERLEACPKCHSMFESITSNRTCQDVAIHAKWCSCHKLYSLPLKDIEGEKCVHLAVSHVKATIKSAKTKRCWGCMALTLKNIIRIHFYYDKDKISLYYVVAFAMTPGNLSYEATVLLKEGKRELIGPVSVISPYRGLGKCTVKPMDRLFCVCQKIQNC